MSRIFRSSTQVNDKLVGSLDMDAKLIRVPKGWSAQTGALLLPDVVIGKLLGEGFQVSDAASLMHALCSATLARRPPAPGPLAPAMLS